MSGTVISPPIVVAQNQVPATQPGVQSVTTTQNAATGCTNTVELNNTYEVLVKIGTYKKVSSGLSDAKAEKVPYVLVYASPSAPNTWEIKKVGNTSGGVKIPLDKVGDYRLYVREPALSPPLTVGNTFGIPFHMKADGTASTHAVQPFFALKVESANCATDASQKLAPPFTVTTYLPNTLGRAANLYPTTGQTYTITAANAGSVLTLNGFTNARNNTQEAIYRITFQLWSDISQVYDYQHSVIQTSTYQSILEKFYKEEMTASGHSRTLTFRFAGQTRDRTIRFDADGTAGARSTRSYTSQTMMTADEAIRRIHPTVWNYWLSVMQTCDITYVKVTSAWRPHAGSVLHRYSLALDFNDTKGIIQIPNPNYHSVSDPRTHLDEEIEITFRCDGVGGTREDCKPTTALSANHETAPTARDKRITFATKILNRIANDKIAGDLGWIGGPWTLKYSEVGITGNTSQFIKTDTSHKHHIHLTVGTELN
jgi:hypothetical protein